jgi:hypothetical protein
VRIVGGEYRPDEQKGVGQSAVRDRLVERAGRVPRAERIVLDVRVGDPVSASGRAWVEGDKVEAMDPASPPDPLPAEVDGERAEGNAAENDRLGHHSQDPVGPADLDSAELGLKLPDLRQPLGRVRYVKRGCVVFDAELFDLAGEGIEVSGQLGGQSRESQDQLVGGQSDLVSGVVDLKESGVECTPGRLGVGWRLGSGGPGGVEPSGDSKGQVNGEHHTSRR